MNKTSEKNLISRSDAGVPHNRADRHRHRGVRVVAMFEAAKGAVVILGGLGILTLIHRNVQKVAEEIVRHMHLNPANKFPRIFVDAVGSESDSRLWLLALAALVYSLVRFIEAYGLWRRQAWAEWFGILSGCIYLPIEVYELTVSVSAVKVILLLVNLMIVGWLSWVRLRGSSRGEFPETSTKLKYTTGKAKARAGLK